jgi:hypothetical protein
MEPAQTIIRKLGGPSAVAKAVGVHRTRVSNWARPRALGGTGGAVPHWHVSKLLEYARATGADLSEADFAPQPQSTETGALAQ